MTIRPAAITDAEIPFAGASTIARAPFIEDARDLADEADTAPPVPMLITGMLMAASTFLLHGDWRTMKTWVLLELLIAGATKTPAFGLLDVPESFTSHFITNEDGPRRLGERIAALERGRGVRLDRGAIAVSAHKGVFLDEPGWRTRIEKSIRDRGDRVVAFDPLRSVTAAVDQGPREFQPFALDNRHLIADTGATAAWVHHDAKPAVGQTDTRRRGHRASGGGILSAADCPVHAERIGEEPRLILTPSAWKHSADPEPIEIELETETRDGKLWTARLVGRHTAVNSGAGLVLAGKIRNALAESPGSSGSALARQVRAGKETVLQTLAAMQTAGEVDSFTTGKNGAATKWMLAQTVTQ